MAPRVFLVTGCSTGFGKEYVQEILDQGDYVIATARNTKDLSFDGATDKNYLGIELDVTKKDTIQAAFDAGLKKFGRVDVVCNNAGYGLAGHFEEFNDSQIRQQMEINFFGLLDVTRVAIQTMRDHQSPPGGLIQQVTSIGGLRGSPLFSIYCASKHAVEGFTEGVSKELKPEWNIKFTCIEPGGFRTDWAGRSMTFADPHPKYDHTDAKQNMGKRNGNQAGDPKKGAKAMYQLAILEDPPIRCVIGTDAYAAIMEKLQVSKKNFEKYEELANSTDVDGYQAS